MAIRSLLAAALLAAGSLAQDGSDASTLGGYGGSSLTVDLGYGVYKGVSNSSTGLNTWKGYDQTC